MEERIRTEYNDLYRYITYANRQALQRFVKDNNITSVSGRASNYDLKHAAYKYIYNIRELKLDQLRQQAAAAPAPGPAPAEEQQQIEDIDIDEILNYLWPEEKEPEKKEKKDKKKKQKERPPAPEFETTIPEQVTSEPKIKVKTHDQLTRDTKRKLKNMQYPFYVRATALCYFNNRDGTKGFVTRRQKYAVKITNKQEKIAYIESLPTTIVSYGLLHMYNGIHIRQYDFEFTSAQGKAKVIKVAKYEAENCVINILRGYVRPEDINKIYKKYPELEPQEDGHVYIDHDKIERIARALRVNIVTYTELGARENMPWHSYGDSHRKKIHIKIANEHATIMPGKLKVSKIVYDEILEIPTTTNVVDYDYEQDDRRGGHDDRIPKYYTIMENGVLIMHKKYRPSTITQNPQDDENIDLAYMFADEQLLYHIFKQENKMATIPNKFIRDIVKSAEHFIGRRALHKFHNKAVYTEYDQNKNYLAYETSPYYQGFPTNTLVPVKLENAKSPAFVIADNILNPPDSFRYFYNYERGQITLPYPVYQYLLDNENVEIEVNFVLDAIFEKISVSEFADRRQLTGQARKDFCNHLIGRTITGGIKEMKAINCYYQGDVERQQLIYECQQLEYNFGDENLFIKVELPNVAKGLFNFHSYILAYAGIHMMTKWKELESEGKTIIAYNVDALVVQGLYTQNDQHVGGWKTSTPKAYYKQLQVNNRITPPQQPEFNIRVPNRPLPLANTMISGPAGISKSYPWLNDPAYDQIILTPTHELKRTFRQHYANTHTIAKYFQFTVDDSVFYTMRKANKIPSEHCFVVIDERTMLNEAQWEVIMRRKGNSIIIALGDMEQICNEIEGEAISDAFFSRCGFDAQQIVRTPETIARHDFAYGTKLDSLRNKTIDEQVACIQQSFANHFTQFDIASVDITQDRVVVGNHMRAHKYNKMARKAAATEDAPFPFRTVGRDPRVVILPVNTPNVYWDRKKMNDIAPKKTKYEPYFAVTADSLQGKTLDHSLYLDLKSLKRHGSVYTAMTRTRLPEHTKIIAKAN